MRQVLAPMLGGGPTLAHQSFFTAANGTGITSYTPDLGNAFVAVNGPIDIQSNQANLVSSTPSGTVVRSPLSAMPVKVKNFAKGSTVHRLYWHVNSINDIYILQSTNANKLDLWRRIAGTWALIATTASTWTTAGRNMQLDITPNGADDDIVATDGVATITMTVVAPNRHASVAVGGSVMGDRADNLEAWI